MKKASFFLQTTPDFSFQEITECIHIQKNNKKRGNMLYTARQSIVQDISPRRNILRRTLAIRAVWHNRGVV